MNKKMLEKMFDERFIVNQNIGNGNFVNVNKQCIDFFFEEMLPLVLNSILLEQREETNHIDLDFNNYLKYIKNKAKELY